MSAAKGIEEHAVFGTIFAAFRHSCRGDLVSARSCRACERCAANFNSVEEAITFLDGLETRYFPRPRVADLAYGTPLSEAPELRLVPDRADGSGRGRTVEFAGHASARPPATPTPARVAPPQLADHLLDHARRIVAAIGLATVTTLASTGDAEARAADAGTARSLGHLSGR